MRISDWSSDVCSSDLPDIQVPQLSDPDYASRPKFRESDLRRHLINEKKVDEGLLEKDEKADPRFTATAEDLKAKGVEDFKTHYALQTIGRIGAGTACIAHNRMGISWVKNAPGKGG